MTIRELLDELARIAEMQSMADATEPASTSDQPRSRHLLTVAIQRAQSRLRDRFSSQQIEAATRLRRILSDETA